MIVGGVSKDRFIAAFVDNLLGFGQMVIIVALLVPENLSVVRGVTIIAGYLGYLFILEGLWGRTLGKYLQGLFVRKLDGERAGWREAGIRTLLRIVEVNPVLFGAFPAGVAVMATQRKQRLGDLLAGTIVLSNKLNWTGEDEAEDTEG